MKKVLVFLMVALMMSSCGVAYLIGTTPEPITEIGGDVKLSVDCEHYELRVNDEIIKKQSTTQSRMWMYTYEEDYYWYIDRSDYETKNSFFPQLITFKVDNLKTKKLGDGKIFAYYGEDKVTGERYHVIEMPWSEGYGRFYFVGNEERQVVYSVPISGVNWK